MFLTKGKLSMKWPSLLAKNKKKICIYEENKVGRIDSRRKKKRFFLSVIQENEDWHFFRHKSREEASCIVIYVSYIISNLFFSLLLHVLFFVKGFFSPDLDHVFVYLWFFLGSLIFKRFFLLFEWLTNKIKTETFQREWEILRNMTNF